MKLSAVKEMLRSALWGMMRIPAMRRALQAVYTEFELFSKHRVEESLASVSKGALTKGPFRGLRYPDIKPHGYMILASKYLGTFEMELTDYIEVACSRSYTTVLNIGSADGYYTVGFAMRIPKAHVIAWEMDPWWQDVTRRVAHLNGVSDRVELRGMCTPEEISSVSSSGRTLVFSDCEGAEFDLLTPSNLKNLDTYDLIVECHDLFVSGVTESLISRFQATHTIEKVYAKGRLLDDIDPSLVSSLPVRKIDLVRAFEEPRLYQMNWLIMTARG